MCYESLGWESSATRILLHIYARLAFSDRILALFTRVRRSRAPFVRYLRESGESGDLGPHGSPTKDLVRKPKLLLRKSLCPHQKFIESLSSSIRKLFTRIRRSRALIVCYLRESGALEPIRALFTGVRRLELVQGPKHRYLRYFGLPIETPW